MMNKNGFFFQNLKEKNILFFIALHFCHKKYRPVIAALIGLYTDWTALPKRLKEPLAIQMRLAWWQEQFNNPHQAPNIPPEIILLKNYDINPLLTAIEYEYVHCDRDYTHQSGCELFRLIANIMDYPNSADNAGDYGRYYDYQKTHSVTKTPQKILLYPEAKLPYRLRFLRIPIILQKKHTIAQSRQVSYAVKDSSNPLPITIAFFNKMIHHMRYIFILPYAFIKNFVSS